ncbi:unnamed protein product [Clavelina lepadiformis]|uniref:Uncharacterized protein n=1 Tax=Clavelina lepadiformis TaxID=159417 RepID=A0ABP0FYN5_CLALP
MVVKVQLDPPVDDSKPKEQFTIPDKYDEDESEEISSADDEIELDEASDTENYEPDIDANEALDEDEESSGDEETGFTIQELSNGDTKLLKLKFDDVEAKRQEYLKRMKELDSQDSDSAVESDVCDENKENDDKTTNTSEAPQAQQKEQKCAFVDYRNVVDADMEEYNSDDDEDFNPVYCGESLSDVEYEEGEERDTESEPEIEDQGILHKKTGEALKCIRMIQKLEIPPEGNDAPANPMDYA